jgi:hypothetical protein
MTNPSMWARLITVLHSLPLWLLIGLAAVGYAAIFVPPFGGIELTGFRLLWGPWFWLDAVGFTVIAVVCAGDLILKALRAARRKKRLREANLYTNIYGPLYGELVQIHITRGGGFGADQFSQRLTFAMLRLRTTKKRWPALKAAARALFDKMPLVRTGEVDYGDTFPSERIRKIVQSNLEYCDGELIDLQAMAWYTRIEGSLDPNYLSEADIRLYDHIEGQFYRLKRQLGRFQT